MAKTRYCKCGSTSVDRCYWNGKSEVAYNQLTPEMEKAWMCNDCGYVQYTCSPTNKGPTWFDRMMFKLFELRRFTKMLNANS